MHSCEFCDEFRHAPGNRFKRLYGSAVGSRIVAQSEHFAALPTLGQLFPGSLLILPFEHVETTARLGTQHRAELALFLEDLSHRVRLFGEPLFFEHGATECSGGSCGIYHAHIHLVPLPQALGPQTLFPEQTMCAHSLQEALESLEHSSEYLLMGDHASVAFRPVEWGDANFPSQFFRRRLTEHFRLEAPWDWRKYDHAEPAVIRTLEALGGRDAVDWRDHCR